VPEGGLAAHLPLSQALPPRRDIPAYSAFSPVAAERGGLVGGIRFSFFPENTLFKIESIVDAHCRPVEDYLSQSGGDKHVWEDSDAVSIRLGDHLYDLTANGGGTIVRVAFGRGARG
jgi:hypothetical protein